MKMLILLLLALMPAALSAEELNKTKCNREILK